ncbi:Flagellar hook-length control protein FliK [Desulfonatronum thiosulfatophilum]|uniref:Flagellar hook-length control protein FliK n=1 Tax=Desulfonatronum thiosulfatophilum TaxID=617002 RepID=A0A1G6E392_9BACT|nr:flagellar hook-length control protein FliK [Desulfonatronum thiosulfatophilum]SDB51868.1 Flagellar hook-length control protein FliK [Desulfonatronum thiosulfatophilum]
MQIFPSFSGTSKASGNSVPGGDMPLFNLGSNNFEDVFGAFMRAPHEDNRHHALLPETLPPRENPVSEQRQHPAPPSSVHSDPPRTPLHLDKPVNREDFARLRDKLEQLGVDRETLDQIEDLYDQPGTVTWRMVLEVLREPLEDLAKIKISPEQERNLLSLFDKLGFSPEDGLKLTQDILDKKFDSVWNTIQHTLSSLTGNEKISITPAEILSLLQVLGLKGGAGSKDNGNAMSDLAKLLGTDVESLSKLDGKTLDIMRRLAEALGKGELKMDPELRAALQNMIKDSHRNNSSLEKIVALATEKELTPEELKKILAQLKDAVTTKDQTTNNSREQILAEVHKSMVLGESREQRMQAADNGVNAPRVSMTEATNALKMASQAGDGKDSGMMNQNADHGAARDNPTAQNKSAQGWESFWNKINVQNTGEAAGITTKDAGPDPRSILGQTNSANNAEAAAKRIISNAPAPHRSVLNQVYSGLLQNMGQGRQQLTLQLNPADLGSLTVNLKVVGKEIQAVLRAENNEARQIIAENMPLLRQTLESQGLRVTRLEVQTQLQDQNQFTQHWHGSEGQKFQEQGAKTQWAALGRGLLKSNGSGINVSSEEASILLDSSREGGINLVA